MIILHNDIVEYLKSRLAEKDGRLEITFNEGLINIKVAGESYDDNTEKKNMDFYSVLDIATKEDVYKILQLKNGDIPLLGAIGLKSWGERRMAKKEREIVFNKAKEKIDKIIDRYDDIYKVLKGYIDLREEFCNYIESINTTGVFRNEDGLELKYVYKIGEYESNAIRCEYELHSIHDNNLYVNVIYRQMRMYGSFNYGSSNIIIEMPFDIKKNYNISNVIFDKLVKLINEIERKQVASMMINDAKELNIKLSKMGEEGNRLCNEYKAILQDLYK